MDDNNQILEIKNIDNGWIQQIHTVEHSEASMCHCCEKSEASDKPVWAVAGYQKSKYESGQFCSKCWDLIGSTHNKMTLDQMVKIVQLSSFNCDELSKNIHLYLYIEGNERLLAKLDDAVHNEEVKTIDPYKAHEEKLKNDLSYQQFLLNQHECVLCGRKGCYDGKDLEIIIECQLEGMDGIFMHDACNSVVDDYSYVSGVTCEEALEKLRTLFEKSSAAPSKKLVEKVECFGDHSGNPWNRRQQ